MVTDPDWCLCSNRHGNPESSGNAVCSRYVPSIQLKCRMAGGLVRLFMDKRNVSEKEKKASVDHGILFTSGLIAGEGLMGVILAIFAVAKLDKIIDLSKKFSIGEIGSLIVFILLLLYLARVCIKGGKKSE